MPAAARDRAQPPARLRRAGKARREGRPGSQETCLRPSPQALVERGWLMLASSRTATVAVICVALTLLTTAPAALAAGPATVTVRVEGLTETKLSATQVTTTTAPVVKDGNPEHACPGTNASGALELATGGNWSGAWFGGKVE